ncbi:glycine cleavage system aminomethyltransferase GcvT [Sphingosinicella soli]|uniref:aminomethyltransferase n=1 Tax=Sphingosinicella soli TaxID=333708 RepID=A0A7W7F571_9SPHN|nr:glycine cleavage system aminomethyltransferase GcvT [Sphingosinicella soli]MBB4631011.1 aminomethyltransferase [Sphingosinicella soli]
MSHSDEAALALPLDALHRELGARMVPFAGYAMPVQFDGIMAEHNWTRESAGLFDVSHMGQLEFRGDGVAAALEALMPGDFLALRENRMRYSLLLDTNGGIIDDLMVTNRGDHFYVVVNGATKHGDIACMMTHLPAAVSLRHRTDLALLALQGPKAADALSRLAGEVSTLVFMRAGAFRIEGIDVWVSRSGYTGEDGFEISVAADHAETVARALLAQPEVRPIGLGARDSLRLEAGLPLYGHDLSTASTPIEADLAFAVSKRRKMEGGFPGAERVLGQLLNGAAVKRIGLRVEGKLPAREGAEIFAGDTKVGVITSGGFAPSVGAPIAMGYVSADHAADGTALEIDVRGRRIAALAAPMPFVPHRYVRQGGQ